MSTLNHMKALQCLHEIFDEILKYVTQFLILERLLKKILISVIWHKLAKEEQGSDVFVFVLKDSIVGECSYISQTFGKQWHLIFFIWTLHFPYKFICHA